MTQALELAARGIHSTPPNPAVGCVVVRDGAVVGEGFHERAGGPHAEVVALAAAGDRARGATAYVSLEPCSHFGRTPPCVDALLAARVARVVCAIRDPNPAAGSGLAKLAAAGVAVQVGPCEAEATELNRGFVRRMTVGRPWVTVKIAASLDGRTALANGASRWITGDAARADVQRLRARASAIVTGIGTVLADDPELTVRDASLALGGRRPLRVVLDGSLRIPTTARVLDAAAPSAVFTAVTDPRRIRALTERGIAVEALPTHGAGLALDALLASLAARECNEVLVEAGPALSGSFIETGLADELCVYLAPCVLGHDARPMLTLPRVERMEERHGFVLLDVERYGLDLRLRFRPEGR
jgi:diaminohydroxyphosphoribosylaminopyrimidine deaminase/5-amino-6-(5-phosphoribosylamino)uracil reductase